MNIYNFLFYVPFDQTLNGVYFCFEVITRAIRLNWLDFAAHLSYCLGERPGGGEVDKGLGCSKSIEDGLRNLDSGGS